jgi:hypothetical protein
MRRTSRRWGSLGCGAGEAVFDFPLLARARALISILSSAYASALACLDLICNCVRTNWNAATPMPSTDFIGAQGRSREAERTGSVCAMSEHMSQPTTTPKGPPIHFTTVFEALPARNPTTEMTAHQRLMTWPLRRVEFLCVVNHFSVVYIYMYI